MFKHYPLTQHTSPFRHHPKLSTEKTHVYIKHEEQYGMPFCDSGTAARKVSFLLPQIAEANVTDVVITDRYGSPFMLHLATQLTLVGIDVHCFMVTQYQDEYRWFMSALQIAGANVYGNIAFEQADEMVGVLAKQGRRIYVANASGTNSPAYMGGFSLFDELLVDCFDHQINEANVFVGINSGVTLAGMLLARTLYQNEGPSLEKRRLATLNIVGVPEYGEAKTRAADVLQHYASLLDLAEKHGGFSYLPDRAEPVTFATASSPLSREVLGNNEYSFAKEFYKASGVLLDPVYGLHTAAALVDCLGDAEVPSIFVNPMWQQYPYYKYDTLLAANA